MIRVVSFPKPELVETKSGSDEPFGMVELLLDVILTSPGYPDSEEASEFFQFIVPIIQPLKGEAQEGHRLKLTEDQLKFLQSILRTHIQLPLLASMTLHNCRMACHKAERVKEPPPAQE